MKSIFKILSSDQWDEAKITGLVPKCDIDKFESIIVHEYQDLENVCNAYYTIKDIPVALEFSPSSYIDKLSWTEASGEKTWREGKIEVDGLSADLVLNIYSFDCVEVNNNIRFKLQGECW